METLRHKSQKYLLCALLQKQFCQPHFDTSPHMKWGQGPGSSRLKPEGSGHVPTAVWPNAPSAGLCSRWDKRWQAGRKEKQEGAARHRDRNGPKGKLHQLKIIISRGEAPLASSGSTVSPAPEGQLASPVLSPVMPLTTQDLMSSPHPRLLTVMEENYSTQDNRSIKWRKNTTSLDWQRPLHLMLLKSTVSELTRKVFRQRVGDAAKGKHPESHLVYVVELSYHRTTQNWFPHLS